MKRGPVIDEQLDRLMEDLRRRVHRLERGRLFCEVQVLERQVVGHRITQSGETERDIERIMTEKKAVQL